MKYVFSDIDGVLFDGQMINYDALDEITKTSQLIICTGRGMIRTKSILSKYISNESIIILENGSKILKGDGSVIYQKIINNSCKKIVSQINPNCIKLILFNPIDCDGYYAFGGENTDFVIRNHYDYSEFIDSLMQFDTCQITIEFKSMSSKNLFVRKCKKNKELLSIALSEQYVSLNADGVNKGIATNHVISKMNYSYRDCAIIGNDINDIEMFNIENVIKIAVCDKNTPYSLINNATFTTIFSGLAMTIKKIKMLFDNR